MGIPGTNRGNSELETEEIVKGCGGGGGGGRMQKVPIPLMGELELDPVLRGRVQKGSGHTTEETGACNFRDLSLIQGPHSNTLFNKFLHIKGRTEYMIITCIE